MRLQSPPRSPDVAADSEEIDAEQLAVPEIYRPMQQWQQPTVWLAARTRGDPALLGQTVRAAMAP